MRTSRSEAGFTLVEVLVATTILLVGVLAAVSLLQVTARANSTTRQRDAATNLAREVVEAVRNVPYDRLVETGLADQLQAMPGLADIDGGPYTVRRGALEYGVAVDLCVMDDPRDGGGKRSLSTTPCAGSAPAGTQDVNPEDYKMATVTISWRRGKHEQTVVQTGLVNNPGSASGPAIRTVAPRGAATVPFTVTTAITSIVVDVTTSSQPRTINWLLDGTVQQPAPVQNGSSGLAWVFTWNLGPVDTGVLDGDYIVSAEAFTEHGVSGPGRQETIILNRRQPFAPRDVAGGRTQFGTVEIEWSANSERDIVGYQVERDDGVVVCPLAAQQLETLCVDSSPPNEAVVTYTVYAYDKRPSIGDPRKGDPSTALDVVVDNQPPHAPANLTALRAADGTVTLRWDRPSPEDPDAGDGVDFYRIYRDGKELTDRYERWYSKDASVTWQDTAAAGQTHTYWVTAVDGRYAESLFLGPVTL